MQNLDGIPAVNYQFGRLGIKKNKNLTEDEDTEDIYFPLRTAKRDGQMYHSYSVRVGCNFLLILFFSQYNTRQEVVSFCQNNSEI